MSVDPSFVKSFVEDIIDNVYDKIEYKFICQEHLKKLNEDSKSIGIKVLLSSIVNDVEIVQCAPFYLTITKQMMPLCRYFFAINKLGETPKVIHISMVETVKLQLELLIESILENNKSIEERDKDIVELSQVKFIFYNKHKECVLYINGARMICIKYSPSLTRFVNHFFSALEESIKYGALELEKD